MLRIILSTPQLDVELRNHLINNLHVPLFLHRYINTIYPPSCLHKSIISS